MHEAAGFELREFLPYLLNQAAEEASTGFGRIYKERYGMLRTEWRVLAHLGRHGSMTARDIGRAARVHKTKISRAVRALEERRFLRRDVDAADRRHEALSLTEAGRAVYADLAGIARSYDEALAARFSAEEARVLRDCLSQLAGFR